MKQQREAYIVGGARIPFMKSMTKYSNVTTYDLMLASMKTWWKFSLVLHRAFRTIESSRRVWTQEGAIILKFFLHISKDEQKQRLQDRLDDPAKRWKFNFGDLAERKKEFSVDIT